MFQKKKKKKEREREYWRRQTCNKFDGIYKIAYSRDSVVLEKTKYNENHRNRKQIGNMKLVWNVDEKIRPNLPRFVENGNFFALLVAIAFKKNLLLV